MSVTLLTFLAYTVLQDQNNYNNISHYEYFSQN